MAATSPPTTVGPGMGSVDGFGPRSSGLSTATTTMSLNLDLPSRDSQLHVAEARAALMASMSNMLDSELQSRASLLHSNAAALSRQEQDVVKATKALRRENDKLAKVAKDAGRKIKELGNVQNWAEVLERDFLVLEETMRLVRDSSAESDGEGSSSDYSGGYWSQSESERDREVDGDSPGDSIPGSTEKGAGKGKGVENGAPNSHGPIIIKSGSASSNASPVPGPSRSATTVSLDEAIMESLAEAMATDIRIGSRAAGQNTAACRNIP
ncbi:hypothetical protein GGR50DRAFT_696334 [Xylaria sp. CBS 124048]|nr:hypothetical protein GGR50DRAFT_696334 [Xylaria sp. CBS 124048]